LLTIAGVFLIVSCYALTWYSAICLLPASVQFGELKTFRDLAIVIARSDWAVKHSTPTPWALPPQRGGLRRPTASEAPPWVTSFQSDPKPQQGALFCAAPTSCHHQPREW